MPYTDLNKVVKLYQKVCEKLNDSEFLEFYEMVRAEYLRRKRAVDRRFLSE